MLARSDNSETVKPVRGEGQSISFAEEDAPPEFLIKKARTEFMVAGTVIDVDWQNITPVSYTHLTLPTKRIV